MPKQVIPAILARSVDHVRLPEKRFTPKQIDRLQAARYHRDGDGRITKVTSGPTICTLRIIKATPVRLDDVDDEQARREGYRSVEEMMTAFLETYQTSWTDTDGWLVQIRPEVRETVRLLARQHGGSFENGPDVEDAGQYTESAARALFQEPEAVDPALVEQGATALEARQRYQRVRLEHLKRVGQMPLGERVERELAAAREAGVETWRYERAILARLEALQRRVQRPSA